MTRQWMRCSLLIQLAVAGVAFAADGMEADKPAIGAGQSSDVTPDVTPADVGHRDPAMGPMTTDDTKQTAPGIVRAGKLLGAVVYSAQDKRLASIKDIVLDDNDTKVGYIVLSYGGTLGMGDKLCAVPYTLIKTNAYDPHARIRATFDEQRLKDAPTFTKDQWPTQQANAQYFEQTDRYYSDAGKGMTDRVKEAAKDTDDAMKRATGDLGGQAILAGAKLDRSGLQWTRRVSELIDAKVESPTGERLGEVKDVVLDSTSGNVRYAVLSFGGIMGMGEKYFAVPIEQFKIQPKDNKLVLGIDKRTLKDAPGFDKNHWPVMTDAGWDKNITQFYQKNPINKDASPHMDSNP